MRMYAVPDITRVSQILGFRRCLLQCVQIVSVSKRVYLLCLLQASALQVTN